MQTKIYGLRYFLTGLVTMGLMCAIGVVLLCRGEMNGLVLALVPMVYAVKNFPAHFNKEEYEKRRRRDACVKTAYRAAFGKWAWLAHWGFLVFFAAAVVCLFVSTALPWLIAGLLLFVLAFVHIIAVDRVAKKHLSKEYYENL